MDEPLHIELFQDAPAPLEAEWLGLWSRCLDASPLQHPRWLIPWWRHFGAGKTLILLALRDRGNLVAVAPFCGIPEEGGRKLMFLGVSLSDYLDILAAPGYEARAAQTVLEFLPKLEWQVADLQPLPAASALLKISATAPLRAEVVPLETLTSLELPGSPQGSVSAHFAERLATAQKRAAALGPVRYGSADRDSFGGTMEFLLRAHHARWHTCPGEARLNAAFHGEAARELMERGALRLETLTIRDCLVAALYAFVHRQRAFFYLMAFDPEFARVSPGALLMQHAIDNFAREGMTGCEFLRGREAFKYRWKVTESLTCALKLHRQP